MSYSESFPQMMAHNGEFYPFCHWTLLPEPARERRLYGVSSGNGNDGVSQMWPDFCVWTDDPWQLARAALLGQFCKGAGQRFVLEYMVMDGEEDYTIYATIYDPPNDDGEPDDGWCDGAWMVVEVFPMDLPEPSDCLVYDSLGEAFDAYTLALAAD